MQLWQDYHTPTTVDDALALLSNYAGEARIIAGGTDLMVDLQFSDTHAMRQPVPALVDVTRISEMTRIEQRDELCYVGGAATHTSIVKSALL